MTPYLGTVAFALFFWLGCVQTIEPFHTYFYFFAWGSYLWIVAALLHLRRQPAFENPKQLLWMGCFSSTLWFLFEAFNFRLRNWSYLGVPQEWWIRWPGYVLSFATVAPGILWTARLFPSPGLRPPSPP